LEFLTQYGCLHQDFVEGNSSLWSLIPRVGYCSESVNILINSCAGCFIFSWAIINIEPNRKFTCRLTDPMNTILTQTHTHNTHMLDAEEDLSAFTDKLKDSAETQLPERDCLVGLID
jgi:hypothetical protein